MMFKHLLGSFLILIIAASTMSPALGAISIKNNSDNEKFITFEISDDEWNNLTDAEKEVRINQFKICGDVNDNINGNVRFSLKAIPALGDDDKFTISITPDGPDSEKMKLLESLNAEEREAYLAKFKENLDTEIEVGQFAEVSLVVSGINFAALSEEELETLKDLTDDEKETFFLEHFKKNLDQAVREGQMTQNEADEIIAARESGARNGIVSSPSVRFTVTEAKSLSKEEIETLQSMTADDKKDFFLSQIKVNLDADVAAGRMTQDEADEIYAYHESGSFGYTKESLIHETIAFQTKTVPATE